MNDQIKALMGQTLDEKFAGTWSTMDMQDLTKFAEKFAQLIVRECVTLADKESERYSNLDQEYCSMAMVDNYRELVRKHFGVEE